MASIVHMTVENYDEIDRNKEALINSYPMMQSPVAVISILVLYLYFVLSLGPKWMEKRAAFELKYAMIFYNLYQVLFSIWLCSHAFYVKDAIPYFLNHMCGDRSINPHLQATLVSTTWWYFFSKVTELLDTVFFVLRKKQSQVSFLHVYHHSIMTIGSWAYLKYLPGEQGVAIGFLNSLVHVVMYFYYFLAALGPRYQKYLWWKKYMTWMQLTQFGIMLVYLVFGVAVNCEMPRGWTYFFITNVAIFMFLFWDYYRKAYKVNRKLSGNITENKVGRAVNHITSICYINGPTQTQCSELSTSASTSSFNDKKKG